MIRYLKQTISYLILAISLVGFTSVQAQEAHDHGDEHEHAGHGEMQLTLDHGQRWETDAPLREGMERIRVAVNKAQQADGKKLNSARAKILATATEEGIAFMFENCNLEPAPDANLHILLARLSAAATAVKADPIAADGLPQMLEVLDLYPQYFNHPKWQAAEHKH